MLHFVAVNKGDLYFNIVFSFFVWGKKASFINCFHILGSLESVIIGEQSRICREKNTKELVNRYQEKVFSFDYDKQRIEYISADYVETFLFGYQE
jgi:hypothetical protein